MTDIIDTLERARKLGMELNSMLTHLEQLKRIGRHAQESTARAQAIIDKIQALDREVNMAIDRTADGQREALEYISVLDTEERTVLYNYYILGYNWTAIANRTYMSERRVFLLRKKALAQLERKFGQDEQGGSKNGNRTKNTATA